MYLGTTGPKQTCAFNKPFKLPVSISLYDSLKYMCVCIYYIILDVIKQ